MNPVLRWGIIVIFIIWLTLVTILGISYALLSTTGGSRWLLEKIDASVDAVELSWQEIDGSLMQGLEFRDLLLSTEGARIEAGSFSVQWDLFDLMQTEMTLSDLVVRNVSIELFESGETAETPAWPNISLPIGLTLHNSRIENLEIVPAGAAQGQIVDLLMISGGLRSNNLRIGQFVAEQQSRGLEFTGQVELSPPYRLALNVQWHALLSQNNEDIELSGAGRLSGDLAGLNLNHQLQAPFPLETTGTVETGFDENVMGLDIEEIAFELKNVWAMNNIDVPTKDFHLTSSGDMNIAGNLNDSHIESRLNVLIPEIEKLPQQQIEFSATVQGGQASLNKLLIETGFGRITGDGDLQWGELTSWGFSLNLSDIDPGQFVPEIPGAIQAGISSSGEIHAGVVAAQLHFDRFEGQIRGFPLSGSGDLAYQDSQIIARNFLIRAGDNQLRLNASLGSELDFSWNLAATTLSQLYPGLGGELNITGAASGKIEAPDIRAQISAESIRYQDISIEEIQANISGSKAAGRTLDMSISKFTKGEQVVDLQLGIGGTLDSHEYDLQLSSELMAEAMSARIAGVANYGNTSWQSDIEELTLDLGFAGQWALDTADGPAVFSASSNRVEVSPFCLKHSAAAICSSETVYDTGQINLALQLSRVHLDLFNEFLPQDVRISGALSGDVSVGGSVDQLEGDLALDAPEIILTITQLQKTEFHRLSANSLSGKYENDQLDLALESELSDNGLIDGDVQVVFASGDQPINGRLEASFSELTWLDPFLPQLSDLDGDTNIDVNVTGTLQNPLIGGDMHISNLTAFVPEIGILLEQGQIDLVSRGTADWDLSASILSGEGNLDVDGRVTLNAPSDWNIEMSVRGDEFNAYALDSTEVFVSPDLELRLSPLDIIVSGDILLPRASLIIKSLPASTVKVSRDEVVITEQEGAAASQLQQGPAVTADVNLILGDQVMFEGFNILGRLAGQLRLRESPGVPQRVEGSIEILDGTYSAYGQELTIDPGQLVFNGPAENPRLNVRAYRTVEGNLVGVHLGGTVETLSSTLYSAPGLPQTEILSLLVTGKSLSNTTSSEGNQLVSALTSLGIAQSSLITESLQNTLSLDVLEISSSDDIEDSSVTIGKYLSPKLFLSYAQDILTPESSVSLDYFLSDKFKINAKSGGAQSMDIFYRIERCPDC